MGRKQKKKSKSASTKPWWRASFFPIALVLIAVMFLSSRVVPRGRIPKVAPAIKPVTATRQIVRSVERESIVHAILFHPDDESKPPVRLSVEVAQKPEEHQQGLMYRKSMAADHGMLFTFAVSRRLSFWMRHTHLSLSIAFVDENFIIANILDMVPLDEGPRYCSSRPCLYAIEVNRGWFERNDIHPGSRVNFLCTTR